MDNQRSIGSIRKKIARWEQKIHKNELKPSKQGKMEGLGSVQKSPKPRQGGVRERGLGTPLKTTMEQLGGTLSDPVGKSPTLKNRGSSIPDTVGSKKTAELGPRLRRGVARRNLTKVPVAKTNLQQARPLRRRSGVRDLSGRLRALIQKHSPLNKLAGDPTNMRYDEINRPFHKGTSNRVKIENGYKLLGLGGQEKFQDREAKVDKSAFAEFEKEGDIPTRSGWKIHLSIHPNNLGQAWDLMLPILVKNKMPEFKVSRHTGIANKALELQETLNSEQRKIEEKELSPGETAKQVKDLKKQIDQGIEDLERVSRGMQVTIYIPEGKEKEYNKILKKIESILRKNDIRAGAVDKSDRLIGTYSSVRHVGSQGYMSHEKVASYNPDGVKDPFKKI